MDWYLNYGKDNDVAISTRVRLARNIKDFKFTNMNDKKELNKIINIFKKNMINISNEKMNIFEMKNIDEITKQSLAEKHLISPDFIDTTESAIILNDTEDICIMINEEDHLRIQSFSGGFDIEDAYSKIEKIDDNISKFVNYAYNDKYGYLTSCPTNIGTGLRISIMLHLPGIRKTGKLNKLIEAVSGLGLTVRGIYGEGTNSVGDVYQFSNKITIGINEIDIIKNIKNVITKTITQERLARQYISKNKLQLQDNICRSYGILSNAIILSSKEVNELLSQIRLGIFLGLIDCVKHEKLKLIYIYSQPANLQKKLGRVLDEKERDIERAKLVKQILNDEVK